MRRTLVALLAVLVALVGCNPAAERGGEQAAPTAPANPEDLSGRIDVWGFGTDNAVGKARVEAFRKEFPNVKVRLTPGDFDEQKFLSAVASGNPPDVVQHRA